MDFWRHRRCNVSYQWGYVAQKPKSMFKELDSLLHSQLRLAIVSLLMTVDEADFVYLREKTAATAGNLSV